jgi:hypothetical protein
MFSAEISDLYAKSVAIQEQENANFLISFTPGNPYFIIRALRKDAAEPPPGYRAPTEFPQSFREVFVARKRLLANPLANGPF